MRTGIVIVPGLLACAIVLGAQSTLERPQLGLMLDRAGAARPIFGVAGSVTFGDAMVAGATGVACSARVCLVKTESAILSPASGFANAPPGPALFALDGDAAFVYFSKIGRLMRWTHGQLESENRAVPGAVSGGAAIVSLRVRKGELEFALSQDDQTWIVRGDGSIVDFVTEGNGPVLLLRHAVMFATADGLVFRRSDGSEARFDVARVDSLFELGENYVEARTAEAVYAVRLEPGREQLFVLPESQP